MVISRRIASRLDTFRPVGVAMTAGKVLPPAPDPQTIRDARIKAGLTQGQAALLVNTKWRVWQQWELGLRRMHPAFWELFLIKLLRRHRNP